MISKVHDPVGKRPLSLTLLVLSLPVAGQQTRPLAASSLRPYVKQHERVLHAASYTIPTLVSGLYRHGQLK